jgi:hypothetical protein
MESFIVRVWEPGGSESPEGVRGTAVHLPSGRELTFSDARTLIEFLAGARVGIDSGVRPAI